VPAGGTPQPTDPSTIANALDYLLAP
jgi:hypothetical protein